jgi:signal transduction histidine kinase
MLAGAIMNAGRQPSDKSQFVLQVTHELRGPIAAVLGYHEMILKGVCGDVTMDVRRSLEKANLRTKRLLGIVDEMLDFAQLGSQGHRTQDRARINVQDLVQQNIDSFPQVVNGSEVVFQNGIPADLYLETNRDLLNIVIANLVANAVKYSPLGGTVAITSQPKGDHMCIQVTDEGMGIEKDEMNRIFGEFYRSRRARVLDDSGTGLGLAIVRQAIDYLGGHMSVESSVDHGSRFSVCLPLDSPERSLNDFRQ